MKRPVEEAVADLLNRSLTIASQPPISVSVGSGDEYEVIGVGADLPPRPPCPRGNVLIWILYIFFYYKNSYHKIQINQKGEKS